MCALHFHDVRTALTVCLRRRVGIFHLSEVFAWDLLNLGKIFVPSKFGYIYSVLMNKITLPNYQFKALRVALHVL